ncbi:minor tail protein [Microbacterium phage Gingerbug]|nr:minor tail protein [Microbacterium phage Gingerbug]
MVDASAPLSGPGPQAVWVQHRRVGQDQGGNYSQFYVEVRYYGNGYGSWTGGTLYWSADVSGWHVEGSFTIPQSEAYNTYKVLYAGYYNRAHNADGVLGAFNGQASINGNVHASIGSGTATFTEPASPRIPKKPDKVATPTVSEVTNDSALVSWSASPDDNGSAIVSYLVRWSKVTPADTPGTYTQQAVSASARSYRITGLDPAQRYYVTIYAKNGAVENGGYSDKSNDRAFDTLTGVYVSTGTAWEAGGLRVSTGSAWEAELLQISSGTAWEDPIDV